jgi:hypothetical protein
LASLFFVSDIASVNQVTVKGEFSSQRAERVSVYLGAGVQLSPG